MIRLGRFVARALLAQIEQLAKESSSLAICMGCAGVIKGSRFVPGYVMACSPECSRAGVERGLSTTDAAFCQVVLEKLIRALQACLPEEERKLLNLYTLRRLPDEFAPAVLHVQGGVPVAGVALVDRPGDELMGCPFCGEPVSVNAGVQRVSHELPVCAAFHEEMRKQPTFFDAVSFLASRKVSA